MATIMIASKNYGSWSLARLAALQDGRSRVRGGADAERTTPRRRPSSSCYRRRSSSLSHPWRGQVLGYVGHRWVSPRAESGREAIPTDRASARPLSRHLRRDALGLQQFALGAAETSRRTIPASRCGRARRPISIGSWSSGANASRPARAPFCSARIPCMADAMYAPVVTRFLTYDVMLDAQCAAYCKRHHGTAGDRGLDGRRQGRARRAGRTPRRVRAQAVGAIAGFLAMSLDLVLREPARRTPRRSSSSASRTAVSPPSRSTSRRRCAAEADPMADWSSLGFVEPHIHPESPAPPPLSTPSKERWE